MVKGAERSPQNNKDLIRTNALPAIGITSDNASYSWATNGELKVCTFLNYCYEDMINMFSEFVHRKNRKGFGQMRSLLPSCASYFVRSKSAKHVDPCSRRVVQFRANFLEAQSCNGAAVCHVFEHY